MMKNKKYYIGVGLIGVVLVGVAVFAMVNKSIGMGGFFIGGQNTPTSVSSSGSDGSLASSTSQTGKIITNSFGGFSFAMPEGWYLENNASGNVVVYPDYDPSGTTAPTCKIEISDFAVVKNTDLSDWLSQYFKADPTADISQASLSQITVGSVSGLEWRGVMNGATTTLVYAEKDRKIIEIAPSSLSSGSDTDNDDCAPALQDLLLNFTFSKDE
jgi:hypothetical protein